MAWPGLAWRGVAWEPRVMEVDGDRGDAVTTHFPVRNDLSKRCRNDVDFATMSIPAPQFCRNRRYSGAGFEILAINGIVSTNHFSLGSRTAVRFPHTTSERTPYRLLATAARVSFRREHDFVSPLRRFSHIVGTYVINNHIC